MVSTKVNVFTSTVFELIAQTSDVPQAFEIDHALGPYLFSKNGEAYLDMVSGFSVSNLGHCHTDIVQAIHLQSKVSAQQCLR